MPRSVDPVRFDAGPCPIRGGSEAGGGARGAGTMPRRAAGSRAILPALAAGIGVVACGGGSPEASPQAGAGGGEAPAAAPSDASLTGAAERIIAFLRGEADFDPALFADTVVLHVAAEGGGAKRSIAREALAERSRWTVGGHRLAPPDSAGELTTRVGSHFNCMEVPLSSRAEELARLPHVGAVLRPPDAASCLQTWNMTLIFDPGASRPELTAVLYDQWEW